MNDHFEQIESSQRQHIEEMLYNERIYGESLKSDFALFDSLKPTICKEGNQWCVWHGEEFATAVIIGFGETIHKAVIDFNGSIHDKIS